MAAYSEIYVEQFVDFSTSINVDDDQGDSLNIDSYTVSSQIRKSPYSLTYYSFDSSISDGANGKITIAMTADTTANISPGRYLYDVVMTDTSTNNKVRVVEGIVNILPGVTR